MKRYFRLLAPVLIAVAVAGCETGKSGAPKAKKDSFAEIKAPSEKAHVHYLKKNGKEYVYLKGKDLRDYTVISDDEDLFVNVRGKQISGKADLEKKSRILKGISTESFTEGSRVELSLKSKQGFKIYRRPSGLLVAMGPGYQEIAEDDLESLDAEVSSSASIDEDLDNLLNEKEPGAVASTPAPSSNADKELDDLMSEMEADVSPSKVETPSDALAMEEQLLVEEDLGRPSVIENIKISKFGDKIQVSIKADRKVTYKQKDSPKGYNQVIVDIPNSSLSSKAQMSVDTSKAEGLITSVTPYELKGPYKTVRVVVQLAEEKRAELVQKGNTILVAVSSEGAGDYAVVAPSGNDDINAARQLSRNSFEDYLSRPTSYYGRRMSLEVANADILDVLRMIQEVGGINVVVSGNVKGKVDVSLKSVPWDQALSVVLQNAQLGYVMQGSVIRVAPLADLRDERKLAAEAIEANDQLEPLRIMVARLNYINAKEAEQKVTALLSSRGKVAVDKDAKTVVVHDIESVIVKTDKLLRSIDTRPMQVAIEANIIEASDSWIRAMGFSWATDSGDIGFKNISGFGNIGDTLGIASVKGDIKIVSSPKISAIDRTTASIIQGTQVAYKTTVSTGTGETSDKVEFENVQVAMNVTPRVTDSGEIILDVDVKREFPDYMSRMSRKMPPGVGVRRATSQIMLRDGDTAVIGGLYSMDTGDSGAGVPLIRKIPIVGWFFGKEESREMKSELLIFLKATIKKEDEAKI